MFVLASPIDFDTSATTIRRDSIQFSVWDSDKETARAGATAIFNALWPSVPPTELTWTGGVEMQRFPMTRTIAIESDAGVGSVDLWQAFFVFDFLCLETAGAGS